MANTQRGTTQTNWFQPDPTTDPDIIAQIAGDETQPGQLSVPHLVKNAQALAEYNRTLPLIRQEAENKQVDDITRQMDTASQIGLRNAQTYQITHPTNPMQRNRSLTKRAA